MLLQGMVFGTIGLGAGVVGTSMSNGLLKLRKKMDPSFESPNKPPDIGLNAATWALHMGVSSNLRYQILNGLDMVSRHMLDEHQAEQDPGSETEDTSSSLSLYVGGHISLPMHLCLHLCLLMRAFHHVLLEPHGLGYSGQACAYCMTAMA